MFVGYATACRADPTLPTQVSELAQAGCGRIFTDGPTPMQIAHRPGLRSALDYLRMGDTFVVLKLDRLALPMKRLLGLLVLLDDRGVAFQSLYDQIDPATPTGQMLCRMLLALAAFEG
jgi:DNA invertase Pin-like site-specific DNA recombinase